jgi:transposase
MAIVDGNGLPLGVTIHSASPAECTLVEETLREIPSPWRPSRMIGDKAYDSDKLDKRLAEVHRLELIAPNRRNRKVMTQDLRPMRRYKRRWKVERFFAWLGNFRRLVTRYERHADNYRALLELACAIIMLRSL